MFMIMTFHWTGRNTMEYILKAVAQETGPISESGNRWTVSGIHLPFTWTNTILYSALICRPGPPCPVFTPPSFQPPFSPTPLPPSRRDLISGNNGRIAAVQLVPANRLFPTLSHSDFNLIKGK